MKRFVARPSAFAYGPQTPRRQNSLQAERVLSGRRRSVSFSLAVAISCRTLASVVRHFPASLATSKMSLTQKETDIQMLLAAGTSQVVHYNRIRAAAVGRS